jgi:hypothetical protein
VRVCVCERKCACAGTWIKVVTAILCALKHAAGLRSNPVHIYTHAHTRTHTPWIKVVTAILCALKHAAGLRSNPIHIHTRRHARTHTGKLTQPMSKLIHDMMCTALQDPHRG